MSIWSRLLAPFGFGRMLLITCSRAYFNGVRMVSNFSMFQVSMHICKWKHQTNFSATYVVYCRHPLKKATLPFQVDREDWSVQQGHNMFYWHFFKIVVYIYSHTELLRVLRVLFCWMCTPDTTGTWAVSTVLQQSLRCLSSLFSSCGGYKCNQPQYYHWNKATTKPRWQSTCCTLC